MFKDRSEGISNKDYSPRGASKAPSGYGRNDFSHRSHQSLSQGSDVDDMIDNQIEGSSPQSIEQSEANLKRIRRTKGEIARNYVCWCGKAYGTENSLNQHKKIKNHHNQHDDY